MNELDWNAIGAATAAVFLGALVFSALLPMLKARLCAFVRVAYKAPVRFAAICLAAGAMIVYGGTKPSPGVYHVVFDGGDSAATGVSRSAMNSLNTATRSARSARRANSASVNSISILPFPFLLAFPLL